MKSISNLLKGASLQFSCGDVVNVKKSGSKTTVVDILKDKQGFIYYQCSDGKNYDCNKIEKA